jgi:hypothetical protein
MTTYFDYSDEDNTTQHLERLYEHLNETKEAALNDKLKHSKYYEALEEAENTVLDLLEQERANEFE